LGLGNPYAVIRYLRRFMRFGGRDAMTSAAVRQMVSGCRLASTFQALPPWTQL